MDCLKSCNICVNTLVLPGSIAKSSYCPDDYSNCAESNGLKLLFVPIEDDSFSLGCSNFPTFIPVLLNIGAHNSASIFCIHFHGNACDIGEVGACALSEGYTFTAHYMIVEYPMFGIAEGFPGEAVINSIARSVYKFVTNELKFPSERIVLIGRSIGTGPACSLASYLESIKKPPAALILHAPYTSLSDAAYDLLGCFSYLFLNRWENWTKLCGVKLQKIGESQKRGSKNIGNMKSADDSESKDVFSPILLNHDTFNISSAPSFTEISVQQIHDRGSPNNKNCVVDENYNGKKENYKNSLDNGVIRCPVLFIHADKDLIIDCHHSQMMHNLRIEAGLTSVLYIQKSVEGYAKGHNYFDYSKEVVIPSRDFLHKYVPYARPQNLDLKDITAACTVPIGFSKFSNFKGYKCPSRDENDASDENEENRKKNDRNFDKSLSDREKNDNEKKSRCNKCCGSSYAASTNCRWILCPCVFCVESSLACLFSSITFCYHYLSNTTPLFQYETKKSRGVDHLNGYKVIKALVCMQSIDSLIREEGPKDDSDSDDDEVDPVTVKNPLTSGIKRNSKISQTKENDKY